MVICSVSNLTLHERMLETSSYLRKLANASKQAAARHLSASEFPFSASIAMVFSISTVNDSSLMVWPGISLSLRALSAPMERWQT